MDVIFTRFEGEKEEGQGRGAALEALGMVVQADIGPKYSEKVRGVKREGGRGRFTTRQHNMNIQPQHPSFAHPPPLSPPLPVERPCP